MTLSQGTLIQINAWSYWTEKNKSELCGYYETYFNTENRIVLAQENPTSSPLYTDEYGTKIGGDWTIYFIPVGADTSVDSMSIDSDSWEKIKSHYNIFKPYAD